MSSKIKLSYQHDKELQEVLLKLGPIVNKYRIKKEQIGRFKVAHINIK